MSADKTFAQAWRVTLPAVKTVAGFVKAGVVPPMDSNAAQTFKPRRT
jgi:hypothetical protein